MKSIKPLTALRIGEKATIAQVDGEARLRLFDLGLVPGTQLTLYRTAHAADPIALRLRGYTLTLRAKDACAIMVQTEGEP